MNRNNNEPFERWLIKKLIGAALIIVLILVMAQIIPEVVDRILTQAVQDLGQP